MHFVASIIVSFAIYFSIEPYLSKYVRDIPNKRSSHLKAVPSAGGLIFIIPFLGFCLWSQNYIYLYLLPLIIISFIDDIFQTSRLIRAVIQIITLYGIVNYFENFYINSNILNFIIFNFLVIVGFCIINLFNFMDGLDGLLSGCMFLILLRSINFIRPELSILIGSLFVFLILNWSPAKIFMGDTGSTFLGAIYFIIIFSSANYSQLLMNLLIGTPLLMDSFSCLFLRLLNKEDIFSPHKKHLYQRLNQAGISHSNISLIYIISTLLLVVVSTFGNNYYLFLISCLVITGGIFLNSKYAQDFN